MRRVLLLLAHFGSLSFATECGLYLAPSSTSTAEEPKWGLFAGEAIPANSPVGPSEIAIQIFDLSGNNIRSDVEEHDNEDEIRDRAVELIEQYIWVPAATGGVFDNHKGKVVSAITGGGVLCAFNKRLTNTDWYHFASYHRRALGEQPGVAHPGRGAYTSYYNLTLLSKEEIPAGGEIFIDYGDNWGDDNEDDGNPEPTRRDFARLDIVIDQILDFMKKYDHELNQRSKTEIYHFIKTDILAAAAGNWKGKKLGNMLPSNPDDLVKVKEVGGSLRYSEPGATMSMEFLKSTGLCMDHLEVGASTIPEAGRGAFAKRPLKEGDIVSPVPLIQIPDATVLDMHDITETEDENGKSYFHRSSDEVVGKQLLLNYCFGHPESTMLFFPGGAVAPAINHSREKANVKLVWSTHPFHKPEWFDEDPHELLSDENFFSGLLMEVVATRDIEAGDEVFLDYGSEWQAAWNKHVAQWNSELDAGEIRKDWPLGALDMATIHNDSSFKTRTELVESPLPEDVRQMCFLVVQDQEDSEEKIWASLANSGSYVSEHLYDCEILEREDIGENMFNYTVSWTNDDGEVTLVSKVPHDAIVFVDNPVEVVPHSFRHYIGIPDDVFPQGKWRNIARKTA